MDNDDALNEGKRDPDLFLIELAGGEQARYVVAERLLTVDPDQDALGIPWSELADLFRARTLRAVPVPGRARGGVSAMRAVSTGPGISNNVEINLVKVEKDH